MHKEDQAIVNQFLKTAHNIDDSFHCPTCNANLNACSKFGENDVKPKPGDMTLCLHCGTLMTFQDDGRLGLPTETDMRDIDLVELQLMQKARSQLLQLVQTAKKEMTKDKASSEI